jgi:hypothetical protein
MGERTMNRSPVFLLFCALSACGGMDSVMSNASMLGNGLMGPGAAPGAGISASRDATVQPALAAAYKPRIDKASAPNGGADYDKHLGLCQAYVAADNQEKSSGAFTASAMRGLMSGASALWSGGFSGSSMGSAIANAASGSATAMVQERAQPKAAQADNSGFLRTCMSSYGYKVVD